MDPNPGWLMRRADVADIRFTAVSCFRSDVAGVILAVMKLRTAVVSVMVVVVSACSSGLSAEEYATRVESLVGAMADALIAVDDRYHGEPTIENIRSFVNGRAAARQAFLEGFEMLDPPESARDLHEVALGVMTRLAGAEAQLASAVERIDSFESWDAVWQTTEAQAMFEVELEAVALCESAQGDYDSSAQNAEFVDTPWIPPEMKDVVIVAFRCRG